VIRLAVARALLWGACASLYACAKPVVPDPRTAALRFAAAAERGDAETIYSMMTEQSRQTYGRAGTQRLVSDSSKELVELGRAFKSKHVSVETRAEVRFYDGERGLLRLEEGQFRVSAAAGLPTGARTPVQALEELREALARRSYPGLVRVLSTETRHALERDLRALVEGLEHPETLNVRISGDSAEVEVSGGHFVKLKREAGVWRVDDFY
jgi:hypothetical protein